MSADEIISRAAQLLIHYRLFWVLGLLMVIGSLVNGITWRLIGLPQVQFDLAAADPSTLLTDAVEGWLLRPVGPAIGLAVLILGGLVFWFVTAAAEGGIIRAAATIEAGESISFRQSWASGRKLLARFVAIDTILFLPLFLLLLAIMLVSSAGFVGTIVVNLQGGATLRNFFQGLGITAVVLLPLTCLLLPLGIVTFFLRMAAFREAALNSAATIQSISQGRRILRQNVVSAAGLALVLYAIRYLVRMLLSIVTITLTVPSLIVQIGPWFGMQELGNGLVLLAMFAGLVAAVISAAGNALLSAYSSTSWTLAYRAWLAERATSQAQA